MRRPGVWMTAAVLGLSVGALTASAPPLPDYTGVLFDPPAGATPIEITKLRLLQAACVERLAVTPQGTRVPVCDWVVGAKGNISSVDSLSLADLVKAVAQPVPLR